MSYQVRLTTFEGPLDLLLQLIEKRELDITTISLATVTDQYLEYIGVLESVQPDVLTDFLVVAAKLILIKSQALLPRPPAAMEEPEEEPGLDLVRQLQEYRRFKEIAALLKGRDDQGLHSYIRLATTGITPQTHIEGLVLDDLVDAMRRALAVLPEEETPGPDIRRRVFSIAEKMDSIEEALVRGPVTFRSLLHAVTTRIEAIVTFLALLEMIKQARVNVGQTGLFGEITIEACLDGASATQPQPQQP